MSLSHFFYVDLPFLTSTPAFFSPPANISSQSMSNHDLDELLCLKLLTIAQFVKTPFINLIAYEISDYHWVRD